MESVNALRMNQKCNYTDSSLRSHLLSRDDLTKHIKCACLQNGYEWRTPVGDLDFPDPTHWGWKSIDNKYIPKWDDSSETVDGNYLTEYCSCTKELKLQVYKKEGQLLTLLWMQ